MDRIIIMEVFTSPVQAVRNHFCQNRVNHIHRSIEAETCGFPKDTKLKLYLVLFCLYAYIDLALVF